MSPETVTLAHRYVLEVPVASGGMATVWQARDTVLARSVAVKMLHPHLAADEDFLRRFRGEALAAARLTHPHVVAIYDSGSQPDETGDRHYIVMEYCGGGSLAELLQHSGPLPPDRAVAVGATICEALGYAHRSGVVHRDVKPANVLLAEDGTIKVADFGIAKAAFAAGDITTTGTILGTVTYMAPEQIVGLEPDARSDLYSLGVLLYELLAGRPPFAAESQLATALAHQHNAPQPLRSLRVGIPRALDAVVMRALAKEPSARFASAEEMRVALEASAPGSGRTLVLPRESRPETVPESPGPEARRFSEYTKLLPVVLFVAVAVLLAFTLPGLLGLDTNEGNAGGSAAQRGERTPPESAARQASLIEVRGVSDFDPHGGDGEHPEDARLTTDADVQTAWETSTYESALSLQKPGVGLLFDLGSGRRVSRVRITSATPGYALELRAGNELPGDESSLEVVDRLAGAPEVADMDFPPVEARYWLVWITDLPGGGGGSAAINEVAFFAR